MRRASLLLFVGLLVMVAGGCALPTSGPTDQGTLDKLQAAGSDLSKLHPFDFYFYHPDQSGAEQICSALSAEGFQVNVEISATADDWLCLASTTMLPRIENLTKLDGQFGRLLDQFGGVYDGWETMVIP